MCAWLRPVFVVQVRRTSTLRGAWSCPARKSRECGHVVVSPCRVYSRYVRDSPLPCRNGRRSVELGVEPFTNRTDTTPKYTKQSLPHCLGVQSFLLQSAYSTQAPYVPHVKLVCASWCMPVVKISIERRPTLIVVTKSILSAYCRDERSVAAKLQHFV